MTDPIHRLLADLRRLDDLDHDLRLEHVAAARAEMAALKASLAVIVAVEIVSARAGGLTWQRIGDALGVTPQRAHELGNLSSTPNTERTRT